MYIRCTFTVMAKVLNDEGSVDMGKEGRLLIVCHELFIVYLCRLYMRRMRRSDVIYQFAKLI